nr:hypothetical protein [uncultured Sphingomonas sp.]
MGNIASSAVVITMIAAALLLVFGVRLVVKNENRAERKRGFLMVICGIVFIINVLIWTL